MHEIPSDPAGVSGEADRSLLRERIALLIETAESQGWHTIVAPIDFMRAAFRDAPVGLEARLRRRALLIQADQVDAALAASDQSLLDQAADMIAALAAQLPEVAVDTADRILVIHLVDILDHALLYLPVGEVRERAQATRNRLWQSLTRGNSSGPSVAASGDRPTANARSAEAGDDTEAGDDAEAGDGAEAGASADVEEFEAKATSNAVADMLREAFETWTGAEIVPGEEEFRIAAEMVDQLYRHDLDRLKRERAESKQFESSMITEWLEAHEKAMDAERRALKARQRERETVERCAKVAEEPVAMPPDTRAIRLTVHAVQRHIAAAIRRRGVSK